MPRPGGGRGWIPAAAIVLFVLGTASDLVLEPRRDTLDAIPDTLRALVAAVVVFGVTGLGVTRTLLPHVLRRHEALWVLPAGACVSGLVLMLLGFCGLPFVVSLAVVLLAGLALSVRSVRRDGPPALGPAAEWRWPLFLGLALVAMVLTPMVMQLHFAGVTGEGSDAHLAAGTANFLQHAYPTSVETSLPVDRMPLLWKSKFPIYYAFGAVAQVSGLETWQAFMPLIAVLLALAACGLFLLARETFGASLPVALVAMGIAGFDRMVLHTGMNPYFNQTWGYMAMSFALVLTAVLMRADVARDDRRRAAALLAIFLAVVTFAYPLAMPIAALPLLVFLWRERKRRLREGLPVPRVRSLWRGPKSLLWLVPAALLLAVPVNGALEKLYTAGGFVLDPSRTLQNWAGDMRSFIPLNHFMNLPDDDTLRLLVIPIVWLAFKELRRQPRELYIGLGGLLAFGLVEAMIFRQREYGYYFHFKILAFLMPLVLVIAAVATARIRRWGPYLLAAFAIATAFGARAELEATGHQLNNEVVALEDWASELPRDASIRLDMAGGVQLWAAYFLADRRTCSEAPITNTDYPHVPFSRKADYVLVHTDATRPAEAAGVALRHNDGFDLYAMDPGVTGPDRCSRKQLSRVTEAKVG